MDNFLSSELLTHASSLGIQERAEFLLEQGIDRYRGQRYEEATILCGAALDIFLSYKISGQLANIQCAYSYLAHSYRRMKRWDEAVRTSMSASNWLYTISDLDGKEALKFAAECLLETDRYYESLSILTHLLEDPLNIIHDDSLSELHFDIAVCYQGIAKFKEAVSHYKEAKKLYFLNRNFEMVAVIEEELVLCCLKIGETQEAFECAEKALNYAVLMNNRERLEYSHNRMGVARIAVGHYDKALSHLKRAKDLLTHKEAPDPQLILENEEYIAIALEKKGKLAESQALVRRISIIRSEAIAETQERMRQK